MAIASTYLSIMILNINGLNSPNERHRMTEWIKKKKSNIQWHAADKRPILGLRTHIGWEWMVRRDISSKGWPKESKGSYT